MQISNLPSEYLSSMKELLVDSYDEFLNSYNFPSVEGINLNLKKVNVEDIVEKLDFIEDTVPWSKSSCYIEKNSLVSKSIYYHTGLYYIQEPSASLAVGVLNPKYGEKVLDMCASPGGKTYEISNLIGDEGLLVSNDANYGRTHAILKNMHYFGLNNMVITNLAQDNLSKVFPGYFDKILVDAPCSGEGMFRKNPKLINSYLETKNILPSIQADILENASKMLKVGGELVYSTCTFNRKENEDIIIEFLENHPEFEVVNVKKDFGLTSFDFLKEAVRVFPHLAKGEGHFVCKLRKSSEKCEDTFSLKKKKYKSFEQMPDEFKSYMNNLLKDKLDGNFIIDESTIYMEKFPFSFPKGFRIIGNGICIGDLKNNKFTPTSHFIRSLNLNEICDDSYIVLDDEGIQRYYKGESFVVDVDSKKKGIYIVVYDKFPVGYCKIQNGRLKNAYEKSWRLI